MKKSKTNIEEQKSKILYEGSNIHADNLIQSHFSSDAQDKIILSAIYSFLQNNDSSELKGINLKISKGKL